MTGANPLDARLCLLRLRFMSRTDAVAIGVPGRTPFRARPQGSLDELLLSHLTGQADVTVICEGEKGPYTRTGAFRVGSYCVAPDQTVLWVCTDFDGKGHAFALCDPLAAAVQCLHAYRSAGLPAYLERSGGGNGWHVWCFFGSPILAAKARALGHLFVPKDVPLERGGFADPAKGHGIEVFPKQDSIAEGGFGHQVWLPWWAGATAGANAFYREDGSADLQQFPPDSFDVVEEAIVDRVLRDRSKPEANVDAGAEPDAWQAWRAEALARLPLESIYDDWLTGKQESKGWLECREPSSPTGDRNPSAGVADGEGEAERGAFHSFISGKTLSVFDFLVERGRAGDFLEACKLVANLTGVPLPSFEPKRESESEAKDPSPPDKSPAERAHPLDVACAKLLCSDIGNGKRLVLRHGSDLRFCHPWRKWLVYDGTRWRTDDTGAAVARAKESALSIYREVSVCSDPTQLGLLQKHAPRTCSAKSVAAMLTMAASEARITITPDEMDRDQWLLNVRNGTIDLRTGKLRPHARGDRITKLAPVGFDPRAKCPTWSAFLERIMGGDATLIGFLQRAVGYTLTGDVGADALLFAFGGGANGKGVFLNTLTAVLGDYAAVLPPELLLEARGERHSTDKTMLHGVRMAVCQEIKEGRRFDLGTLKSLTGRDPITARRMREDNWTFLPTHKLWLAANNQPRVPENDEATWRRILLVPFSVTIPEAERDPGLSARCAQEAPGILAWAVRGLADWRACGEGRKGLGAPEPVSRATAAYREQEDMIGVFLRDRCVLVSTAAVAKGELYEEFKKWCEGNHECVMAKRNFIARIDRLDGVSEGKVGGNRGWRGIGIRGPPVQDDLREPPRA